MSDKKLLVTGASGKLGRKVVSCLLDELNVLPQNLIVTTRKKAALEEFASKGIEVREADFSHEDSLVDAFKGADNLLLISVDAIGQRTELHTNAVKAAEKAGVQHISYTSMPSADTSPIVFAYEHIATERAIAESEIPSWTLLRNNWYYENLPEFFASVLQSGTWLSATDKGRSAEISRADLAFAAAVSLVKGIQGQKTLTLNGPESLDVEDRANIINSVLGTSINVVHMTDEALESQLKEFQLPEGLVSMLTTMDKHGRGNYSDGNSDEYEILTGRKPQTFAKWLEDNREYLLGLTE